MGTIAFEFDDVPLYPASTGAPAMSMTTTTTTTTTTTIIAFALAFALALAVAIALAINSIRLVVDGRIGQEPRP